jgi:hypothetical protein
MLPIRSCDNSSVWEEYEPDGSARRRRGGSFTLSLEVVGESWFDLLIVPSDLDTARWSRLFPSVRSANSRPSMFDDIPSAPVGETLGAYNPRTTAIGGPPDAFANCGLSPSFTQTCRSLST